MTEWLHLEKEPLLQILKTGLETGLTQAEAEQRLAKHGPNELIDRGVTSPWRILWEQLTAIMVVILIIAAVISAVLGDFKDAIAIMVIVILNSIFGFTQEYRAEKAMAALKRLAVPNVKVRRDERVQEISARALVPGDVVLLEAGSAVPADGRLFENASLRAQEAALTGESEPVEKTDAPIFGENIPLGDRKNMVYMGTNITYGRGMAVITATGMDTELGHIANMLQTVEREPTPLQRRLEQLGRGLAVGALVIVAIVFFQGLLRGEDPKLMLLTAISMAVAAVPEGLPAVVTIGLALGAQRMLRRQTLIRKLPAVETLGSVTVICSDKTGTLTENRMTVTILDVLGATQRIETLLEEGVPVLDAELIATEKPQVRSLGLLLKAAALCNDAVLQSLPENPEQYHAIGDPTEGALIVAAGQLGLRKAELDKRWPRIAEAPFTSERKRMTTVHRVNVEPHQTDAPWRDAPYVAFSKGAVDGLLEITKEVWAGDNVVPLTAELQERIMTANDQLAANGQRILGVAFRPLKDEPITADEEGLERELVFIGLIGMIDPPRREVKEAVQTCLDGWYSPRYDYRRSSVDGTAHCP